MFFKKLALSLHLEIFHLKKVNSLALSCKIFEESSCMI